MVAIRELVRQALDSGYLTKEAEHQLHQIFNTAKYTLEDLDAFMSLQLATMAGRVKQESLEMIDQWYGPNSYN